MLVSVYVVVKVHVDVDEQELSIEDPATGSVTTFRVADFVILTSQVTDEEFHGQIRELTANEVRFVLICGSQARVALEALESGKCTLKHQPPLLALGNDEGDATRTLYDERTILDTKQMRLEARLSMGNSAWY